MQDVRIDRLSLARGGLILQGMKKAIDRYPTSAELYALEQAARRERARVIAELLASGARSVKGLFARAISVLATKTVRHA